MLPAEQWWHREGEPYDRTDACSIGPRAPKRPDVVLPHIWFAYTTNPSARPPDWRPSRCVWVASRDFPFPSMTNRTSAATKAWTVISQRTEILMRAASDKRTTWFGNSIFSPPPAWDVANSSAPPLSPTASVRGRTKRLGLRHCCYDTIKSYKERRLTRAQSQVSAKLTLLWTDSFKLLVAGSAVTAGTPDGRPLASNFRRTPKGGIDATAGPSCAASHAKTSLKPPT